MPDRIRFWLLLALVVCARLPVPGASGESPASGAGAAQRNPSEPTLTDSQREHWAFQPVKRPVPPRLTNAQAVVRNPIDQFVLARLEAKGLSFSPPVSKAALIRRVTFDLIGLPPTPEEIDVFMNDSNPDAYERLIDRLLASPHYGERWGRHWLDLVRYAETDGFEHDAVRPHSWRYRDYVIRSFNEDKPYDRFIREQLAGDELWPQDPEALIATGFNLLGPDMVDSSDQVQRRHNTLNDMTDTTALAFLGLTMGCARCHNHKFEPLSQIDYYSLQACFAPAEFHREQVVASPLERTAYTEALKQFNEHPKVRELAELDAPVREKLRKAKLAKLSPEAQAAHQTPLDQRNAEQANLVLETEPMVAVSEKEITEGFSEAERHRRKQLVEEIKSLPKPPPLPKAMALANVDGPPAKTCVLHRGEYSQPGEEVEPGFPCALSPGKPSRFTEPRCRTALANWIASRDNPLTARVMVNRIWQHHFGRGLVATPSDFGTHGQPPTHPELLDWLAAEFVEPSSGAGFQPASPGLPAREGAEGTDPVRGRDAREGRLEARPTNNSTLHPWSLKHLHRLILTSATYRQTSASPNLKVHPDPENQLYWRMNRLRLEGEVIRDSLLAISGQLNPEMGGPGVYPPIPESIFKGATGWTVTKDPREHARRSVYIFARRNFRFPFLEVFDAPDNNLSCPARERSTTAPQALTLLNADEVMAAAQLTARRVSSETSPEAGAVEPLFRLTLGRPPTPAELAMAREFLKHSPLNEICRALFNLNDFLYVE